MCTLKIVEYFGVFRGFKQILTWLQTDSYPILKPEFKLPVWTNIVSGRPKLDSSEQIASDSDPRFITTATVSLLAFLKFKDYYYLFMHLLFGKYHLIAFPFLFK